MIFSSYIFLFAFLPVVLVVYFALARLKAKKLQRLFLLAASLYFYAYFNFSYLFLILASIAINYASAAGMHSLTERPKARKACFIAGILFNVGLLWFFKYYDFFISTLNLLFLSNLKLLHILLPLGISFFTFQQLSFIVSIYKKEETLPDFLTYCLFVTFFPQLIAGPIVLFSEMRPQFENDENRFFNWNNFSPGFYLFVIGMSKKLIVADTVAIVVNEGFKLASLSFETAWATALAYTVQIYFDFSGYNDMAVGLGKMFNFNLPSNFNSPYKSATISEFWRRWHITLGRALTTYIYIPLGGNRLGLKRTCINLMLVFLVSGIWHGANYTFILWGVLHGAFIVAERIMGLNKKTFAAKSSLWAHRIFTFLTVNFLWVLFRAESVSKALEIIKAMLNPFNHSLWQFRGKIPMRDWPSAFTFLFIGLAICFWASNAQNNYCKWVCKKYSVVYTALLLLLSVFCMNRLSPFIYFNF